MKGKVVVLNVILPLSISLIIAVSVAGQTTSFHLASLGWLSGCWESRDDAKQLVLSEQWMKPEGGMMIGMGRTVKGGKAVDWEFMRIEQRGKDLYYLAKPKENAAETPFKLIRSSASEAVFENPEHDFPQRVIYRLAKSGNLEARIEGTASDGKVKGIDFPMDRKKCQ